MSTQDVNDLAELWRRWARATTVFDAHCDRAASALNALPSDASEAE
jgi:hypothetical protein